MFCVFIANQRRKRRKPKKQNGRKVRIRNIRRQSGVGHPHHQMTVTQIHPHPPHPHLIRSQTPQMMNQHQRNRKGMETNGNIVDEGVMKTYKTITKNTKSDVLNLLRNIKPDT